MMERFRLQAADAILEPPMDERNRSARVNNDPTTTFATWLCRDKFKHDNYIRMSDAELHAEWQAWATNNNVANAAGMSLYNLVNSVCRRISWLQGAVGENHLPGTNKREFCPDLMRKTLDILMGTRADGLNR